MTVAFRRLLIMTAGVATTLATLVLVGMTGAIDLMGSFHAIVFTLPTGAFALGVLAGSGYGIAGWFLTRLRLTPTMLKWIALSMVLAFAGILVIEYVRFAPRRVGFFEYIDRSTRSSTFARSPDPFDPRFDPLAKRERSERLGADGYGWRLVELMGLTLGGMGGLFIVPAVRRRLGLDEPG